MSRQAMQIVLTAEERKQLEVMSRSRSAPARAVERARIVLMAGEGHTNAAISERLKVSRRTVGLWRSRFAEERMEGLLDRPGRGRRATYSEADRARVITMVCTERPLGATHWTVRSLAARTGMGRDTIHRILREEKLQPHRLREWVMSSDPEFEPKALAILGLYVNPPENALVLSVDEKTSIQALDRTQPMMPLRPGQAERRSFEYKRNGTVSLYAALAVHHGKVIGQCAPRHRHQEFLDFLRLIVRTYPEGDLHLIVDNLSAHKHRNVMSWLKRHPRVHFHFTPTHASWLNQVEIWFSILSRKAIWRGVFRSVHELVRTIVDFIEQYNRQAVPFRWTFSQQDLIREPNCRTVH